MHHAACAASTLPESDDTLPAGAGMAAMRYNSRAGEAGRAHAQQIRPMRRLFRSGVQFAQMREQRAHGIHVLPIVSEHIIQKPYIAAFQIIEVALRGLAAGQIVRSTLTEDDFFDTREATGSDAHFPCPSSRIKQIKLFHLPPVLPHAAHCEAGFEQWQIKVFPIEGTYGVITPHTSGEVFQHIRFVAVIAH